MTIGELIRLARKEKGMTQKQVAELCGMADSAIRKYESGSQTPKLKTLQRIATALGVSYWDLIPDLEPDEEEDPSIMEEILKDFPYQTEFGPMSGKDIDRAILLRIKSGFSSEHEFYDAFTADEKYVRDGATDGRLFAAYLRAGHAGKRKIADYAEDILPRYRRQDAPQPPAEPQEGKDTTPPSDAPETPPEGE